MKKFWIQLVFLLLVIMALMYYSFGPSKLTLLNLLNPNQTSSVSAKKVQIDNNLINIEISSTADQRSKGLGGRDSLASDGGMLFVFGDESKHRFWMKGMRFPLDFIFIDHGKVVDLLKNIPVPAPNQPDSELPIYEPISPVDMVLEVNAGYIDNHGIKSGDMVYLVK